jgi:hypothetical protein
LIQVFHAPARLRDRRDIVHGGGVNSHSSKTQVPLGAQRSIHRYLIDAIDAKQLVPRMLATNDRHTRRADAKELPDEPAQRLVGATVKRRRRHAHDRDALANRDELVLSGARLYPD